MGLVVADVVALSLVLSPIATALLMMAVVAANG